MNTEELVEAYINLRNAREKLLTQYEAEDKKLQDEMALLEKSLLDICNTVNADSIKTAYGTVMRKLNERFFCQDWDIFYLGAIKNETKPVNKHWVRQVVSTGTQAYCVNPAKVDLFIHIAREFDKWIDVSYRLWAKYLHASAA